MSEGARAIFAAVSDLAIPDYKVKQLMADHGEDVVLELLRALVMMTNQNAGNRSRG